MSPRGNGGGGGFSIRTVTVLALVALLLVPATAAAGWGAKGFREPDTTFDAASDTMFKEAPPVGVQRIYFNGFLAQGRGPAAECAASPVFPANIVLGCDAGGCPVVGILVAPGCITPSVAVAGGSIGAAFQPAPAQPMALLGEWRDCNRDGYIGYGDLGLWEYRSELLAGATECLVELPPFPLPMDWRPSHNDGKWVREFLPLGWNVWGVNAGGIRNDANIYDLNDSAARVWADFGLPDAPTAGKCNVNPAPRDSFRKTGGMLEWSDCLDDFAVTDTWNSAMNATGQQDLSFNDARRDHSSSSSALNKENPWGKNGDKPYAEMCSGEEVYLAKDPVYSWDHTVKLPHVVPVVHPEGSVSGQVGEAYYLNTWMRCHQGQAAFQAQLVEQPYFIEGSVQNIVGARTQPDFSFQFYSGKRPSAPLAAVHTATPDDLGVRMVSPEGFWRSDGGISRSPIISRGQLNVIPLQYITYYAQVGENAIARYSLTVPPGSGKYGSTVCPVIGTGAASAAGWACDPDAWWPGGNPATGQNNGAPYGVTVGQSYRFRDVDCYDASTKELRNEGLDQSMLTGTRCSFAP